MQFKIKVPKEIPVAFHNGSTYDNYFIIKQLPEEFEGQFECIGKNTEKYETFSVPIKEEVANGKKEEEVVYGKDEEEEVANGKKEDDSKKEEDDDCKKEDNNSKKRKQSHTK